VGAGDASIVEVTSGGLLLRVKNKMPANASKKTVANRYFLRGEIIAASFSGVHSNHAGITAPETKL
jgi:hypothetical protein